MTRPRDECSSLPQLVVHSAAPGEHQLGCGRCWCQPEVRHVAQRWRRRPMADRHG